MYFTQERFHALRKLVNEQKVVDGRKGWGEISQIIPEEEERMKSSWEGGG